MTSPFQLNTATAGDQTVPRIYSIDEGGFVAVWNHEHTAFGLLAYVLFERRDLFRAILVWWGARGSVFIGGEVGGDLWSSVDSGSVLVASPSLPT